MTIQVTAVQEFSTQTIESNVSMLELEALLLDYFGT